MSEFLSELWKTTTALAPSLILGLLVAGILHVFVKRDRITGHLGRPGILSSVKAAVLGVPLPLCSCGVLPAAVSLRKDGASDGAVTSFLISTPQTGVDSISVTWGMLGLPVAAAKVAAAFLAGVIGGALVDMKGAGKPIRESMPRCADDETGSVVGRIWRYTAYTLFKGIYGWITLGILVSALITIFLEPGQLSEIGLLSGPLGLLAALALGIPMYVCSVASVPIAAGLIYAGFPVGSALVFLMAGPATNAATIGAVRKMFGKRVFMVYLSTVILVSIVAGMALNSLHVSIPLVDSGAHGGWIPAPMRVAAGLVLVFGTAWFAISALLETLGRSAAKPGKEDGVVEMEIGGMTCSGCENRVRNALASIPGVSVRSVSSRTGRAAVVLDKGDANLVAPALDAVRAAGYSAETVNNDPA